MGVKLQSASGTIELIPEDIAGTNQVTIPAEPIAKESQVIGIGQTWQDMTGSRAWSTTYTNTTGKPIQLIISCSTPSAANHIDITVDGITIIGAQSPASNYAIVSNAFIIPNGSTYSAVSGAGLTKWIELR